MGTWHKCKTQMNASTPGINPYRLDVQSINITAFKLFTVLLLQLFAISVVVLQAENGLWRNFPYLLVEEVKKSDFQANQKQKKRRERHAFLPIQREEALHEAEGVSFEAAGF